MNTSTARKPYFESWLKRTRKQLSRSGRLTELAWILSREDGTEPEFWRSRLWCLLQGEESPSLDLLMKIDTLLAGPGEGGAKPAFQQGLF